MGLYYDLHCAFEKFPNKKALFYRGHFYTYRYFLNQINLLSEYLVSRLQLHQSNVVSICLDNSPFSLALIYACNRLGIIIHLINPTLSGDEIIMFDSICNSRIMFLEKDIYIENYKLFSNIKEKITVVDNETFDFNPNISFKKLIKNIKYKKLPKAGIPFSYHVSRRKAIENFDFHNLDVIAVIGANERYNETPYICCFSNKNLHAASFNQSKFFDSFNEQIVWSDFSLMSIPGLISFYHSPLLNGITLCMDRYKDDYKTKKILKSGKIGVFCGDYQSYDLLFESNEKLLHRFLNKLKAGVVYNDYERYRLKTKWSLASSKCRQTPRFYSVLGSVETCGFFATKQYFVESDETFGKLIEGIDAILVKANPLSKKGKLYLKSDSNMIAYYKEPKKTDELYYNGYLNSQFIVSFDKEKRIYIHFDRRNQNYLVRGVYIKFLKQFFDTIPGVKMISFSNDENQVDTIKMKVVVNHLLSAEIQKEIENYFSTHLKKRNVTYQIIKED